MKYRLAPSILSGDFANLGEGIRQIEAAGATDLHFDVMDGIFVPNISFGIPVLKSLRPFTDMFMDVHLMITEPIRYVDDFADAGADLITFHVEACQDAQDIVTTIGAIHAAGKQAGLVINPKTSEEELYPFIEDLELVLIMGVQPGFGGQGMIDGTLEKAKRVRDYIDSHHLDCDLEFDGGVKTDNLDNVLDAGINVIVAGSAVFKGDVKANAAAFMDVIRKHANV